MEPSETSDKLQTKLLSWLHYRPTVKQVGITFAVVVSLLIAANLALGWYYQDHYHQNLHAGATDVSGMTEGRARQVLIDIVDRRPLTLQLGDRTIKISTSELGVEYNIQATVDKLNAQPKPAVPIMAFVTTSPQSEVPLSYTLNKEKFEAKVSNLIEESATQPQDARLEIKSGKAQIIPDKPGYKFHQSQVAQSIKHGLSQLSSDPVILPSEQLAVKVNAQDLASALEKAQKILRTPIALKSSDKEYKPTKDEVGSWLSVSEQHQLVISEAAIAKYIERVAEEIDVAAKNQVITTLDGIETNRQPGEAGKSLNRTETAKAILTALQKPQSLEYQLKVDTVEPTVEYVRKYSYRALTYSYCVNANGVSATMLGHFSQKIASTLSDTRGWSLNGQIQFQETSSGCSFNLILAAANTLPGYSSGCSVYWSCRVGSNVIINVDRWAGASDSWNQAGGTLDEYQSMVINHEVGHWLGFDHWSCGGAGQPAPVMLQQSIDLQGCAFNVWPTTSELNSLKQLKGI